MDSIQNPDPVEPTPGAPDLLELVMQLMEAGRHSEWTHGEIVGVLGTLAQAALVEDAEFANKVILPAISAALADLQMFVMLGLRSADKGFLPAMAKSLRPGFLKTIQDVRLEAQWLEPPTENPPPVN